LSSLVAADFAFLSEAAALSAAELFAPSAMLRFRDGPLADEAESHGFASEATAGGGDGDLRESRRDG